MSSFSEAVPRSIVMRGVEARTLRPARIAADLRSNPFVGIHGADPRLCDPSLEAVVAEAVVVAEEEARAAGWDAGHRAGVEAGRQEARERLAVQLEEIAERDRLERAERAGQWATALATLPDPSDLHPGGSVTLVADESVERGGCIVEAGERHIDAQLGPALDRVRSVLRP